MAELSPDTEKALEALSKIYPELEGLLKTSKSLGKQWAKQFSWSAEHWPKEKALLEQHIKQIKLVSGPDGMTKFANALKGNTSHLDKYKTQLQQLDNAIEELADTTDDATAGMRKQQLEELRNQMAMKIAGAEFRADLRKTGGVLTSALGSAVTQTIGKFTSGLQGNASATELTTTLMNGAVDAATAGTDALGKTISGTGSVLSSSTNPKLKVLGAVADVAGSAIGSMGQAAGKLAKFGIEVLSKEVERTVKAFNETSAAGALFADGMTGMRNASAAAGLTTEQFASVVKNNADSLAASGLGVTGGAKAIGDSMRVGGANAKKQLLNLGYSFEEQAGLYAETAAAMRRTAGGKSSDAAVAEQTMKYAENLRLIAAITGEDAKRKTAEAKQQNQILAFQQQLAGKSADQRAQIDAAMATMTEVEKKNFRDRVVLGTVINKEGAIYEATVAGAKEKGDAVLALFNSNALTADANFKLTAQYGEQIKGSILNNKEFAVAGMVAGGVLGDVAASQLAAVNQANITTEEAREAAKKNLEGQKNANDALTKNVTDAAVAAQQLKIALQETLLPAIADFAKVSSAMLQSIQEMVSGAMGASKGESLWEKTKRVSGAAASGAVAGGAAGAMVGGTVGTAVVPLAGTAVGAIGMGTAGAILGGLTAAIKEAFWGEPGKALGGISEGPSSGYMEKLHGVEAVVPLSAGRSIPVDISGMGAALRDMAIQNASSSAAPGLVGGTSNLYTSPASIREASGQEHVALLREIRELLTTSKDLQQQFVQNTYA
jgi:hypothetical protein